MNRIIYRRERNTSWLWRIFGLILLAVGIGLFIFAFTKAPEYGWFHAKAPFTAFGHTYQLDGYSIVPLALEIGIIFLEFFGIWLLATPRVTERTTIETIEIPSSALAAPAVSTANQPQTRTTLLPTPEAPNTRPVATAISFPPAAAATPAPSSPVRTVPAPEPLWVEAETPAAAMPRPASIAAPTFVASPAPIASTVVVPASASASANAGAKRRVVIEARQLSKVYENGASELPALQDIDLAIFEKEIIAIVGKSGSGKSTIMHILATLDQPTSGELIIDGIRATDLSSAELDHMRNRKFGFVFQQFFLNGKNTCLENVILPLAIMGISATERNNRGLAMLDAVGLKDKAEQPAGTLSGGQKQRLCIARALITKPEVIFADEPTGNLDSENGKRIVELLFRLQREQGITVVIVTHDPDLAALCDRAVTIRDGKIQSITSK